MNIVFTPQAWEEFTSWIETDVEIATKINELIKDIRRSPFKGLGKPEPLKHSWKGYWSRRITDEHRLVYKVDGNKGVDQRCAIVQCMFHYDDK